MHVYTHGETPIGEGKTPDLAFCQPAVVQSGAFGIPLASSLDGLVSDGDIKCQPEWEPSCSHVEPNIVVRDRCPRPNKGGSVSLNIVRSPMPNPRTGARAYPVSLPSIVHISGVPLRGCRKRPVGARNFIQYGTIRYALVPIRYFFRGHLRRTVLHSIRYWVQTRRVDICGRIIVAVWITVYSSRQAKQVPAKKPPRLRIVPPHPQVVHPGPPVELLPGISKRVIGGPLLGQSVAPCILGCMGRHRIRPLRY